VSRATPAQVNFNGGEISRRLHARFDLNIYDIALATCEGWVPLIEGGLEACPGTLHVAIAKGPCRLIPFRFSRTQEYVVEMSAGTARFYTNDARIEVEGAPIELAVPYDLMAIRQLRWEQSYDVLYLYHPAHQTRELVRVDGDTFELHPLALENGPFEPRNKDEALRVRASGVQGVVTLTAERAGVPHSLFEPGDVGGLFQMEADDFGDVRAWEPGITVSPGQLLTWNERVYRVVGGAARTGTIAPVHSEGVEWDGIGQGTDLNDRPAGGVQLEYRHDRFGTLRITGFVSASEVTAQVLRMLPLTAAAEYDDTGGYWNPDWGWVPAAGGVEYVYGTWRWRFGAFSNRRGWPSCGVIWNNRHVLAKDSTLYASVAGDLANHATLNELGEISTDMAFQVNIEDPNGITGLIAQDQLLVLTGAGSFVLRPTSAAQGIGPGSVKPDRQSNEGAAATMPTEIDGRSIYIGKSRRRLIEGDFNAARDRREPIDLTRYARHVGARRFVEIASQKDPNRLIWAICADGTMACATYVPEEQVLGWSRRTLAPGIAARSIASIAEPDGELDQLWIAAEFNEAWHVLRMDRFRQEGDADDPAMLDMAQEYEGDPRTSFSAPLLAGRTILVEADGAAWLAVPVAADGAFSLPQAASRVTAGLPFPAPIRTLRGILDGDTGPGLDKMKRIGRLAIDVLQARGLEVRAPGGDWTPIEQLEGASPTDTGFDAQTGLLLLEDQGDYDREAVVELRRVAPHAATLRAIQRTMEVMQR
jgi:hypothetical protein